RLLIKLRGFFWPTARPLDQSGRHAVAVIEQNLQQMFRYKILVSLAQGIGLGGLHEAPRPLGVLLEIHHQPPRGRASRSKAGLSDCAPPGPDLPRGPTRAECSVP